jgi:hypothetical protein
LAKAKKKKNKKKKNKKINKLYNNIESILRTQLKTNTVRLKVWSTGQKSHIRPTEQRH